MDAKYQKYYDSLKDVNLTNAASTFTSSCDELVTTTAKLESLISTASWTELGVTEIESNVIPSFKQNVALFKNNVAILSNACSLVMEMIPLLESLKEACSKYDSCPDDEEHQSLKYSYRNNVTYYEGIIDAKVTAIKNLNSTFVDFQTDMVISTEQAVTTDFSTDSFVNYYQGDYKQSYGYGKTISEAGCGPTSMAMVLTNLLGKEIDPVDTAQYSMDNGYRIKNNGTSESLFPALAKEYGLNCEKSSHTAENIVSSLKAGNVIIAHMGKGHFTKGGHYIVLRGLDEDGKVIVSDPASSKRSKQTWSASLIADESKGAMYSFSV